MLSAVSCIHADGKGEARLRLLYVPALAAVPQGVVRCPIAGQQPPELGEHIGLVPLESPSHGEIVKLRSPEHSAVPPGATAVGATENLLYPPAVRGVHRTPTFSTASHVYLLLTGASKAPLRVI